MTQNFVHFWKFGEYSYIPATIISTLNGMIVSFSIPSIGQIVISKNYLSLIALCANRKDSLKK